MVLEPGSHLGGYEILALIGSGGMGEVYKARDTRLGRDVAIKALPALFTRDPERLARFRREAQVLAALNHSHIAQIHGLEAANDVEFLVLELVDGETLADRIARGALPLDEAIGIARQIGDALAAAHEKGIIHRDLKPANVALNADGQVKVLDFGLAKAVEPNPSPASSEISLPPTITSPAMTAMGLILGTAAYMAPEQAKGRAADKRCDIWAFGCVLFEMLTGRRAFDGDDVSDTLAAILRAEPDWSALPAGLPPGVRLTLTKCLAKDRRERFADITTPLYLLTEPALARTPSGEAQVQPQRRSGLHPIVVVAVAVAASVLTAFVVWALRPSAPRAQVARFFIPIAPDQPFTNAGRQEVAASPDGLKLAYVLNRHLYVRSIAESAARSLATPSGVVTSPVFSPDGRSIAFWSAGDGAIERIPIDGGPPTTIAPNETNPFGLSWSDDHVFIGRGAGGIERVSQYGGAVDRVVALKGNERAYGPQLLPDGDHLLFTLTTETGVTAWEKAQIVVQSLKTGVRTTIVGAASDGRYLPSGILLYARAGVITAGRFDARRLALIGAASPVLDGVGRAFQGLTAAAQYAVSDSGTLAYVPGPSGLDSGQSLAIIDETRHDAQALKSISSSAQYWSPRVAPGGRWLATEVDDGPDANVWIYDLTGGAAPRRLTFGGHNRAPVWSADGKRVAFQSDREGDLGIFWQLADGTGVAERLTRPPKGTSHVPESASPDGKWMLVAVANGQTVSLQALSIADGSLKPFGNIRGLRTTATFSPDGAFVAYEGADGVYVQPFPATGAEYFIIGGIHPFWAPDGRDLFVSRQDGFSKIPVSEKPTFSFGARTVASPIRFLDGPSYQRTIDVLPDGAHLVGITSNQAIEDKSPDHIEVVLNWLSELETGPEGK